MKITRRQLRQIIKEELNRVVLNEEYDIEELPSFQYTVKAGDTPGELALMATGDASNTDAVNYGNPIKAGDVIDLRYLISRGGTTRKNPATGRTLELPAVDKYFGRSHMYDVAGPDSPSTDPGLTYEEYSDRLDQIEKRLEDASKIRYSDPARYRAAVEAYDFEMRDLARASTHLWDEDDDDGVPSTARAQKWYEEQVGYSHSHPHLPPGFTPRR